MNVGSKSRRYPAKVNLDPVYWQDGALMILDQRYLPEREIWISATDWQTVAEAISSMAVRGAPLIGVAAAYGVALADRQGQKAAGAAGLSATRPTAVNLFHAVNRAQQAENPLEEAHRIKREEIEANEAIGRNGSDLLTRAGRIVTICSTGSLATPGIGTALGVIKTAFAAGKLTEAILLETRPRLQGLRLNAWELMREGIPFRVIPDGAISFFLSRFGAELVVAGADRIASNGDTANKIGTYSLAISANSFKIPFAIAAPTSTIDPSTKDGSQIIIEERSGDEITAPAGLPIALPDTPVWNPAFDVTPASLITHIVTERGNFSAPYDFGGVFLSSQS